MSLFSWPHHHSDHATDAEMLACIHESMQRLLQKESIMQNSLDTLVQDVQDETTVETSIETLLSGVAGQLKAAGQDQAKLDALHSSLVKNVETMKAAVVANTPAAPTA